MKIYLNFWIKKDNHNYLGRGKIELLKQIEKTGSLSQAAKNMQMSYKAAWDSIQSINKHAPCPVVTTTKGGKNGGGSSISCYGKKLIQTFDALEGLINLFEKQFDCINDLEELQKCITQLQEKLNFSFF